MNGKSTPFKGKLYIEFKKLEGKDNPKICAFYVAKGTLQGMGRGYVVVGASSGCSEGACNFLY